MRRSDVAAGAGQDHDVARMLGSELWQRGLDEIDLGKEQGLELVPGQALGGEIRRKFLDGADDS